MKTLTPEQYVNYCRMKAWLQNKQAEIQRQLPYYRANFTAVALMLEREHDEIEELLKES